MDWDAAEAELVGIDERIPAIGSVFPLRPRSCPAELGRMWCMKIHEPSSDPVHACAHPNYGVVAVWEDGFKPQVHADLVRRCGPVGMLYLIGRGELDRIVVVEPPAAESRD